MKHFAFAVAATLMFATSANAGGFAFSLPSLTYPPSVDVTVGKECLPTNDAPAFCSTQR